MCVTLASTKNYHYRITQSVSCRLVCNIRLETALKQSLGVSPSSNYHNYSYIGPKRYHPHAFWKQLCLRKKNSIKMSYFLISIHFSLQRLYCYEGFKKNNFAKASMYKVDNKAIHQSHVSVIQVCRFLALIGQQCFSIRSLQTFIYIF